MTINIKNNTPFFIVGCVRSGTTLLRDILKQHPKLVCPEETHFFRWTHPFGAKRFEQIYRESELLKKHRSIDGIDELWFQELLTTVNTRTQLMIQYAEHVCGGTSLRWFDKTPQHVYGLLLLSAAFPGAKFIHIHRNPLNVVSSLMEGKVMPVYSLTGAINYWLEAMMIINRYKEAWHNDFHEVSYQAFTEQPFQELEAVFKFLGEDISLLDFQREIVYPEANKYLTRLTREQALQTIQYCEPYCSQYGYHTVKLPEPTEPIVINSAPPPKPLKSKTLIFILGMHRSGTSAAARLLDLLGVELGSNFIEPIPGVNDSGFWEHRGFNQIHEKVLTQLDSAWYDTRPLPENWWRREDIRPFYADIVELLHADFNDHPLIGLKDPRLCRLLPLWIAALETENMELKCVMIVRHPLETAQSVEKRDGFHRQCGLDLWMLHVLEAEFHSRGMPRMLIRYEDLLADPKAVSEQIGLALDTAWPVSLSAADIRQEIRAELRHHTLTGFIAETAPEYPYARLYQQLAQGLTAGLTAELNQTRQHFQATAAEILFKTHRELTTRAQALTDIGNAHHKALSIIQERDQQLAQVNEQLQQLGQEHSYALEVLRERDQQLAQVNEQLQQLGQEHSYALEVLRERDRQAAELQTHWSHKLYKISQRI